MQSLRIWHIAPLFLPLLLGSTNIRNFPAASAFEKSVPPIPTHVLMERELSKFRAIQPLPNQTLNALAQRSAPQKSNLAGHPQPKNQPPQRNAPIAASVPQQASLASAISPEPAHNLPPIPLRVAVALQAKVLNIATSDNGVVTDQSGHVLGQLVAQSGVMAASSPTGLQIGPWQTPSVVWIKPKTEDGLVFVEGHWYRGSVQLISQSDGLLAVNHVDLESYLYSVVGAEMPAYWSGEALKAQAIAARSYAVVHLSRPANDLYDLGATPRWQAYSGAESETNTTQMAVNQTRGILLSYQGGVVESLYASSSQLVKEAHGGFGMSQEGANQLAQKNFSYAQILGYFYPGTGLAVLNIH